MWQEGENELLKYLGFGNEESDSICLYFADCMKLPYAHYLLQCPQLSRTQASIKELEVNLDGKKEVLVAKRSYCSGVKVCANEGCNYTVSTKQKINQCKEHQSVGLHATGLVLITLHIFIPKIQNVMEDVGLLH